MSFKWTDGTDYLAHHGIKGQKWGVRRFQNEDGSYTAAGQVRRELNSGSSIFSRRANDLRYSPTQSRDAYKKVLDNSGSYGASLKLLKNFGKTFSIDRVSGSYAKQLDSYDRYFSDPARRSEHAVGRYSYGTITNVLSEKDLEDFKALIAYAYADAQLFLESGTGPEGTPDDKWFDMVNNRLEKNEQMLIQFIKDHDNTKKDEALKKISKNKTLEMN